MSLWGASRTLTERRSIYISAYNSFKSGSLLTMGLYKQSITVRGNAETKWSRANPLATMLSLGAPTLRMASSNFAAAGHYSICFYTALLTGATLKAVAAIGVAIRYTNALPAAEANRTALRIWGTTLAAHAAPPIRWACKAPCAGRATFFLTEVDTLSAAAVFFGLAGTNTLPVLTLRTFATTF